MLLTNQFVKENLASPNGKVLVTTFKAGKRQECSFEKNYWVGAEFFTDEVLKELHGEPTYYGPTDTTYGIRLWLDGSSYINFFITKKLREKIDRLLND